MPELWVPYRRHAATFAVASLPLFGVALVGVAVDSVPLIAASLAVAFTPLLIAGIIWLICLVWDRRLRDLAREDPLILRWTYERDQWERHVASQRRKARLLGPLVAGGLLLVGVIVAVLLANDEDRNQDTGAVLWILPIGISLVVGVYVWAFIHWNAESTRRERIRRGGEFLLGINGFYLTGEYRPLSGMGQTLTGIEMRTDGDPHLVFTWYVSSGRTSSDHEVVVPVPPGREEEAQRAIRMLLGDPAD